MQGILFKSEMTLANLNGLKSRTSRTRGLKKINENPDEWKQIAPQLNEMGIAWFENLKTNVLVRIRCPYGVVGSELYGKETYSVDKLWDNKKPTEIDHNVFVFYHADTSKIPIWVGRTRSPMMMPEWASRYHVILDKIIAQRIQSITNNDAWDEGVKGVLQESIPDYVEVVDYISPFQRLWDSINDKPKKIITPTHKTITILEKSPYSWKSNPWVWALYYRVQKKEVNHD